ncbi:hypothetical protein CK220_01310 [Mesorhizobium sp. WSM3860]|nr:hypothetical protein CK220_01310 [Mesorhizobium sp. WSM3860]
MIIMTKLFGAALLGACLVCLPPRSEASQGSNIAPEEQNPECNPLKEANEWVIKVPVLEMTSRFVRFGDQPRFVHQEIIYTQDAMYSREGPYGRWTAKTIPKKEAVPRNDDGSLVNTNCHRLYNAVLDGVKTIVFQYDKTLKADKQWYRCNIWVESPNYRPLKAICEGPFEWTRRWFYRSDVKIPVPKQGL